MQTPANPSFTPTLLHSQVPAYTTHGPCPKLATGSAPAWPQGLTLPVLELQVVVVLGCALWRGCALQKLLGALQVLLLAGQVQWRVTVAVLQPGIHSLVDQRLDHTGLLQVHGKVERSLERMWGQKSGEGGMTMTHRTPSVMSHASLAVWAGCRAGAHPCPGVKCG